MDEYGKNKGYRLPSQYYQDIAWGGLTHTGAYDASGNPVETTWFQIAIPNATERKRISDNIAIEQSGEDLNGNNKTQNGKNASC